jgi:hypothetical protein
MMTPSVTLRVLPVRLAISRLPPESPIPDWASAGAFLSITRTVDELSIVCPETSVPPGTHSEPGWRALQVKGPLDFALIGILASIAQPLSVARIPIFAVSTFDTDYVLVRDHHLDAAVHALTSAGHHFE